MYNWGNWDNWSLFIYSDNQKTMEKEDDIRALLKCIWWCCIANSFTRHLLNYFFCEMGLFKLHNYYVSWLLNFFKVKACFSKSSYYSRVFWLSLYDIRQNGEREWNCFPFPFFPFSSLYLSYPLSFPFSIPFLSLLYPFPFSIPFPTFLFSYFSISHINFLPFAIFPFFTPSLPFHFPFPIWFDMLYK